MKQKFKHSYTAVSGFLAQTGRHRVSSFAAGISFYFFLSVIPFCILLCSLLPYTGISQEDLIAAASMVTPETLDELLADVIGEAYTTQIGLFSVSLLTLIWSSSKAATAIIRCLDDIYGTASLRKWYSVTRNAVLFTLFTVFAAGGGLFFLVRGLSAEELILRLLPKGVGAGASRIGRNLLVYAAAVAVFALVYKVFPAGKRGYLSQVPGAALTGLGLGVFSAVFGAYTLRGSVYTSFYGSLAGVAVFLAWLYTGFTIFLMGAVFNAMHGEAFARRIREKKLIKMAEKSK